MSEAFSLLICPDATNFVLLSFFTLTEKIWAKASPNNAGSPPPADELV